MITTKLLLKLNPKAPQSITGVLNADGSIEIEWDAVQGAKSYLIHYGGANQSQPSQAIYMGYSTTNKWTLADTDIPVTETDDKLYFYVQAYEELGVGATDAEKAQYLHDGDFLGSAWSKSITLTV